MNSSLHERAGELLLRALDLPPEQRPEFIERACGDDTELLEEVRSLLAASSKSLPFVDAPGEVPSRLLSGDVDEPLTGQPFGAYRIRRRIAAGGMGVVYEAEQDNPRRIVALKVMRRGMTSRSAVRRFQFEVQALARLRHAGIAQVYDAGVHEEDGARIPYFAMEYVHGGGAITAYADEQRLGTRERLALFAGVCAAVHHGHQQGIIHRDLKPDNVLVDTSGQPKVIDFGVARATDLDAPLTTRHTGVAQIVGTLPYMSPEQISGNPNDVDTRTDVYSLGVILFQLLTGRMPVEVAAHSLIDAIDVLRSTEPPKLGSLDRSLRGDIETIVAKALTREKERRYQSAGELAADIGRFLKDEPIGARPPTTMYQLRKFARRNRGLVTGALVGVIALLVGTGVAIRQALIATHSRDVARQERAVAHRQAYLASVAAAEAALQNHDVGLARRSLERAPAAQRGWEWYHLRSRLDQSIVAIPGDARPRGAYVRFLDNDVIGAWNSDDRRWVRWDAHSGKPLPASEPTEFFHLNPNGTGRFRVDGNAVVAEDLETGTTHRVDLAKHGVPPSSWGRSASLSNSRRFFCFSNTGMAVLFDLQTGETFRARFSTWPSATTANAVSDAGQVAIAAALHGSPALWDVATGELKPLPGATTSGACITFSPDGKRVVAGSTDATLRMWDARTCAPLAVGRDLRSTVNGVAYSPDGQVIASTSSDRTVRLWDADTLEPLAVLDGHGADIVGLQFSADGTRLLTIGDGLDRALRVWDVASAGDPTVLRGHDSYVYPVAVSPDGTIIASGGWDDMIRLWDADTLTPIRCLSGCTAYLFALSFSPDGSRLLSVSGNGTVRVWNVASGDEINQYKPPALAKNAAFCSDGQYVYLPGDGVGAITLWNTTTGALAKRPFATLSQVAGKCVSADGQLAVVALNRQSQLVRVNDGQPVLPCEIGSTFAFSPPSTPPRLADIDPQAPCEIRVWDLDARVQIATLRGHTGRRVYDIVFSPDGSRIMTAGDDQLIRVWDAATFDEIVPLAGHRAYVWSLAFRPDGTQLVSGSGDGTVRVWDTIPFAQRRTATPR